MISSGPTSPAGASAEREQQLTGLWSDAAWRGRLSLLTRLAWLVIYSRPPARRLVGFRDPRSSHPATPRSMFPSRRCRRSTSSTTSASSAPAREPPWSRLDSPRRESTCSWWSGGAGSALATCRPATIRRLRQLFHHAGVSPALPGEIQSDHGHLPQSALDHQPAAGERRGRGSIRQQRHSVGDGPEYLAALAARLRVPDRVAAAQGPDGPGGAATSGGRRPAALPGHAAISFGPERRSSVARRRICRSPPGLSRLWRLQRGLPLRRGRPEAFTASGRPAPRAATSSGPWPLARSCGPNSKASGSAAAGFLSNRVGALVARDLTAGGQRGPDQGARVRARRRPDREQPDPRPHSPRRRLPAGNRHRGERRDARLRRGAGSPRRRTARPGIQMCYFVDSGGGLLLESWFHYPASLAIAVPGWLDEHAATMRSYPRLDGGRRSGPFQAKRPAGSAHRSRARA